MTGSVDVVKKSEMIVLGVFDGNGATADVAQYCADNSARIINEEINKQRPSPSPMVDKIKNLFRKSEANVNSSTTRP
jgi:hypothetical protein